MRIWLVFVAVGMLVLLGCGSSQDTVAPAPAPPSMTTGEAIGLVQSALRGMCAPDEDYLERPQYFYVVGHDEKGAQVVYREPNSGYWFVHASGVIETRAFEDRYCQ